MTLEEFEAIVTPHIDDYFSRNDVFSDGTLVEEYYIRGYGKVLDPNFFVNFYKKDAALEPWYLNYKPLKGSAVCFPIKENVAYSDPAWICGWRVDWDRDKIRVFSDPKKFKEWFDDQMANFRKIRKIVKANDIRNAGFEYEK
jgi:hypothetical protein